MKSLWIPLIMALVVPVACSHREGGKPKMTEASSKASTSAPAAMDHAAHDSFAAIAQDTQNTLQTFLTDTEAAGGPKTEVDQALVATATEALKSSAEDKAEIFADRDLVDVAKDVESAMDDEKGGKKSSNSDMKTASLGGFSAVALVGILGVIGTKVAYNRAKGQDRIFATAWRKAVDIGLLDAHQLDDGLITRLQADELIEKVDVANQGDPKAFQHKGEWYVRTNDAITARYVIDFVQSNGARFPTAGQDRDLVYEILADQGVLKKLPSTTPGDWYTTSKGDKYKLILDTSKWGVVGRAVKHSILTGTPALPLPVSPKKYYAAATGFGALAVASTAAAALTSLGYMPGLKLAEDATDPTSKCLHALTELAARITALRKAQDLPTASSL